MSLYYYLKEFELLSFIPSFILWRAAFTPMWRSEDYLQESVLSSNPVGPRNPTSAHQVWPKHL